MIKLYSVSYKTHRKIQICILYAHQELVELKKYILYNLFFTKFKVLLLTIPFLGFNICRLGFNICRPGFNICRCPLLLSSPLRKATRTANQWNNLDI